MLTGAKKDEPKPGLGTRFLQLFQFRRKQHEDVGTETPLPTSIDVTASNSTSTPAAASDSPKLSGSWLKKPGSTVVVAEELPPLAQDTLPTIPVSTVSPASSSIRDDVAKESEVKEKQRRHHHHDHDKRVKKEKKAPHQVEGSAAKEKKHHHKKKAADAVVAVATAVSTAAPIVVVTEVSTDVPKTDAAPPDESAAINARLQEVAKELNGLDVQHTERTDYLMAHDPHAPKIAGILRRTNSGRQVLESEGTNTHPLDQLPGHPLHPSQQKLEWIPEREAEEEENRKKEAEDKKIKPF